MTGVILPHGRRDRQAGNRHTLVPVNCNLRCTIVTPDARVYHLALQTDCRETAFSLDFPHPTAMDADSDPEMAVFGKSFAMRTQASVFDLQLQMDTLP